jgi:hypothetical protein
LVLIGKRRREIVCASTAEVVYVAFAKEKEATVTKKSLDLNSN